MNRDKTADLFGYRGDEEREARRIVAKVEAVIEAAPDLPRTGEDDIKRLVGNRIDGLLDRETAVVKTYPVTLPEVSIEVDESGRLAIGEFPSTFPESHNGGKE